MDKMALFVEGQTEQQFITRLFIDIAGHNNVHVDAVRGFGGRANQRKFLQVSASRPHPDKKYYILIYDCAGDSTVLSDINDQYESLVHQGYRDIVGIRDVYPLDSANIPTLRDNFRFFVKKSHCEPALVLGVREVEAWFIAEHTHFARRHASLTLAAITAKLGYDPSVHDVQLIPHPAADLNSAYSIAGLAYTKRRKTVERVIEHLDYARVYVDLIATIPDLRLLIERIDAFLSPSPVAPTPVIAA